MRNGWRSIVLKAAILSWVVCFAGIPTERSWGASQKALTPFEAVTQRLLGPNTTHASVGPPSQIISGSEVTSSIYPFQVSLLAAAAPSGQESDGHFCGGSLIAATWVLTAAHCVTSNREVVAPDLVDVYAGSNDFNDGDRISVKTIIRHPGFVPDYFENDVALLQLAREPDLKLRWAHRVGEVDTVDLRTEAAIMKPGAPAKILGWGATERSDFSRKLHQASVEIIERAQCNRNILQKRARDLENALGDIARSFKIDPSGLKDVENAIVRNAGPLVSDTMFCAGDPRASETARVADACQGDSGGPIIASSQNGRDVQIGIISWGEGCGVPKLYGVYTRLAKYADWIAETTRRPARTAAP